MKKSAIPKLPFNLEPQFLYWLNDGRTLRIVAEDEKCVYMFNWDGLSVDYGKMWAQIKEEIY